MKISATIKRFRLALHVSQTDFAQMLKLSASAISHYEGGLRKPSWATIKRMVKLAKTKRIKLGFEDFIE